MLFNIKKGLDLPIKGQPDKRIDDSGSIKSIAVLGDDYVGLKPTMMVQAGDKVKAGSAIFEDKKNPGVIITSPASGVIATVNRGAKRALLSVVIDVDGNDAEDFGAIEEALLVDVGEQLVREKLQHSGLWVSLRTRPYGKVPAVDAKANSIFVNAMDSNPLAADPQLIINESSSDFINGVKVLSNFDIPVYLCQQKGAVLPTINTAKVQVAEFSGPHPSGLSSTHVHFIDPVYGEKSVWTIGYQDVMAIGRLFVNGQVDATRYVALGGPLVNSPRVLKTLVGANLNELLDRRTNTSEQRVVSGSVLNGHDAKGDVAFLGRYDNQVVVLDEDDQRKFMSWITPGANRFSALNVFISSLMKPKNYDITTSQNGSPRAMVPVGVYEKVMPLDILPTPLLRSLLIKDTDTAQKLGCLELVEEDLALCSFVDPGKHDFGLVLRDTLTQIEREG